MEITSAVATQVLIMAIYILIGFIMTKAKVLTKSGTKQLADILLMLVTPCVIIKAFQDNLSGDVMGKLVLAFALSLGFHVAAILIVSLLHLKTKSKTPVIDKFCTIYSNCGFMGIPLLESALGSGGVLFGSAYLTVFNLIVWTHGYGMYSRNNGQKVSWTKIVLNPGVISIVIAIILLIFKIQLPEIPAKIVGGFAALNTPVAMILLGVYLGEANVFDTLKKSTVYKVCFERLILLPVLALFAFRFLGIDVQISTAIALSAGCPCATIAAIFAAQSGRNTGYASAVVAISTVFSIGTLPLISYLSTLIL